MATKANISCVLWWEIPTPWLVDNFPAHYFPNNWPIHFFFSACVTLINVDGTQCRRVQSLIWWPYTSNYWCEFCQVQNWKPFKDKKEKVNFQYFSYSDKIKWSFIHKMYIWKRWEGSSHFMKYAKSKVFKQ